MPKGVEDGVVRVKPHYAFHLCGLFGVINLNAVTIVKKKSGQGLFRV